jgi:hypothetical protein
VSSIASSTDFTNLITFKPLTLDVTYIIKEDFLQNASRLPKIDYYFSSIRNIHLNYFTGQVVNANTPFLGSDIFYYKGKMPELLIFYNQPKIVDFNFTILNLSYDLIQLQSSSTSTQINIPRLVSQVNADKKVNPWNFIYQFTRLEITIEGELDPIFKYNYAEQKILLDQYIQNEYYIANDEEDEQETIIIDQLREAPHVINFGRLIPSMFVKNQLPDDINLKISYDIGYIFNVVFTPNFQIPLIFTTCWFVNEKEKVEIIRESRRTKIESI